MNTLKGGCSHITEALNAKIKSLGFSAVRDVGQRAATIFDQESNIAFVF